jgi:hypothetical protein
MFPGERKNRYVGVGGTASVQERENTDMWGWEGQYVFRRGKEEICGDGMDSKCPGEGKYRYVGVGGTASVQERESTDMWGWVGQQLFRRAKV